MIARINNRGFVGIVILILLVLGLIGIYFGYSWYQEKNFISLYDGDMTRKLDIPPFAERKFSAINDLKGEVTLKVSTSPDQIGMFFKSSCDNYGYTYEGDSEKIQISIRAGYVISGEFKDNLLVLKWNPVLDSKNKKRYEKAFKKPYKEEKKK